MKMIGHPASLMGDDLRREVEQQLLDDLAHYLDGADRDELELDWSGACQEGHRTAALGGELEEMSGVGVRARSGRLVAEGWIDFIHGGANLPLIAFWLFLDLVVDGAVVNVKKQAEIPEHVWEKLTDESKLACTRTGAYDSRWHEDPRVVAWKRTRV